jgi:hypothetical protein
MERACNARGSRNTPLVLSRVRDDRIRCWSHLDERCAGFFRTGSGQALGPPGGGDLHFGDGGGQPGPGGDLGMRGQQRLLCIAVA